MREWWRSPLQHLQKAARASSPLFQAELEGNNAAIIQQDLEPVSLVGDVYRSRLSADVKDPLLASGIPTEGRIGRGEFHQEKSQQPERPPSALPGYLHPTVVPPSLAGSPPSWWRTRFHPIRSRA